MSSMPPSDDASLEAKLARLAELESDFAGAVERAKLAALKEFAYGASHEINNPLANISTRAQALLADERHPERRKKLATIVAQAFRAHEMISDLMLFAKPPPLELAEVRLGDLIAMIVGECQAEAREQKTEIAGRVEPLDLTLRGDATQLGVALKALVRNALEALSEGGHIRVDAIAGAGEVMLSVTDDGPGVAPQIREHIFDPFYSGREAGRGLGFGLPKCWRIAELHGGRIEVASKSGQGTTLRLVLPTSRA
jgi:signal transduction histidine kinase